MDDRSGRPTTWKRFGEQCLEIDSTLQEVIDQAVPLTEYAWKFRYPGEPYQPTADEATEALAMARLVYEAVLQRVFTEAQPFGPRA